MLVENEEPVVTGAAEVAVPNALFLITVSKTYTRIDVEHDFVAWPRSQYPIDPATREVGEATKICRRRKPLRFEATHLAR